MYGTDSYGDMAMDFSRGLLHFPPSQLYLVSVHQNTEKTKT